MAGASVGKAIDKLWALKQELDVAEAAATKIKDKYEKARDKMIDKVSKQTLDGAVGKVARVAIVRKENPIIDDPKKFKAYILKTKDLDLLQQRVSSKAVKERWDAGKKVPGIGKFTKVSLRLSKITKTK